MGSRSPSRSRSRSRGRSPPRRSPSGSPRRRSPSRSRSPADGSPRRRSRSRSPSPIETEHLSISDDDAAFVLGKGGSTKNKLARVSGARLELNEKELRLDITGGTSARRRAREYVQLVLAQRVGPVSIDFNEPRDDLSINVPEDCVGYVMGKQGQALRGMEEEWGTLMVFAKVGGVEKLAIFGTRRARRGAELKVMSAVEHKKSGYFVTSRGELRDGLNQPGDDWKDGWGYDTRQLSMDEFSYALGRGGETRKKLARAADCIMEYVGNVAVMAGFRDERKRARDYLEWLLQQRKGPVSVETRSRDDVTVVEVPRDSVGYITGHKGESLREIERQTGTFCFANGEKGASRSSGPYENLLIFGASAEGRRHARRLVEDKIDESRDRDARRDRGGGGYGGGGGGYRGGGGGGGGRDYDRGGRDYDRDRYSDRDRRRSRSRSRDRRRSRSRSR